METTQTHNSQRLGLMFETRDYNLFFFFWFLVVQTPDDKILEPIKASIYSVYCLVISVASKHGSIIQTPLFLYVYENNKADSLPLGEH